MKDPNDPSTWAFYPPLITQCCGSLFFNGCDCTLIHSGDYSADPVTPGVARHWREMGKISERYARWATMAEHWLKSQEQAVAAPEQSSGDLASDPCILCGYELGSGCYCHAQ